MTIGVLGPLRVDDGAVRLGSRDRVVLAALAMSAGKVLSADQLADAVWHERPPASWNKNLQGCVVRLRKALGQDAIQTSPQGYRLAVPADTVDAQRFGRLVMRGRELLTLGESERVMYTLDQALALWRGRPLVELEEWEPGAIEGARLEELRLEAQDLRLEAALQAGHHREMLAEAKAMVSERPLREQRWALLALAQYRAGRQSDALRTLQQARRMLVQELGLDPGPDIDALEQAILRQDSSLLVEAASTQGSAVCPYRGLTPYDVDDAEGFFGRDADVAACFDRLNQQGVLAVVGPSGSGKSSLVRAGIAARLEYANQDVVVITPGVHPLDTLGGLRHAKHRQVLVIDQCEEAFSQCDDPAVRETFLATLVDHAETAPVVISLRADRLGEISSHPGFARLVERGLYLLGAMSEEDLRAAIEGPARQAGLVVEPGLVDLLVREVEGEPGALPLLSHAMRETWLRREGRTLTVSGYQASGGIRGAVAKSAEEVYGRIAPDQRHLLRDTMLRLVTPGTDGEPVRSRIARRQVVSDPAQDHLIDLLVAARLVTSDDGVVQLAHEALARAWPRLRGWLDDDVEGQRILHHLTNAADAWDALGRPDSETYRGIRLAQTLDWRDRTEPALTNTERAFLAAGERLAAAEERSAKHRARHQTLVNRRLRGLLAASTALLVAAVVAGALAVEQKRVADNSAAVAQDAATAAEAGRSGARALATDDIDEAVLLAAAGVRLHDTPETRSNLLAALGRHPELIASTQMAGPRVVYFDVSPNGKTVATYDAVNHVRLYDIDQGELLAEYQAGSSKGLRWETAEVKFSPDGHALAVTGAAPTRQPIQLLDADTLKPLDQQPGGLATKRWQLIELAFSEDGHHVAATMFRVQGHGRTTRSTTAWAAVWNLESLERPARLLQLQDGNPFVALSPDGNTMYTTQPFTIHDLASGTSKPVNGTEPLGPVALRPDGRVLATGTADGLVLLDAATGDVQRQLQGNEDEGYFPSFSSDGSLVATATFDKREAMVWDVATGAVRAQIPLGEDGDLVQFGDGDSTLYSAGSDSALRHWDLDGDRRFVTQIASTPTDLGDDSGVQPAPGGEFIAYPSEDHVTFLDVGAGRVGEPVDRSQGRYRHGAGSWSADGVHYALVTGGEVRVFDARKDTVTTKSQPSGRYGSGVDYSTDGSRLVVGELSGRVIMLDATTLAPVGRAVQLDESVRWVSAGPDNHTAMALTGFEDASGFWVGHTSSWVLVDLEAGTVLNQGNLGFNARMVAFSPDGRHAALGGADGELLVLDTETGEPLRPPVLAHNHVVALSYSTDGDRILTSGLDATVALWDAETGRLLSRLTTPVRLPQAGFGANEDSVLIAGLWGGPVYQWDPDSDYAVDFACRVAGRDLTEAEWRDNFGDRPYQETCPA